MNILVDCSKLLVPHNGTWRVTIEVIRALRTRHGVTLAFPHQFDNTTLPKDLHDLPRIYGTHKRNLGSLQQIWWEVMRVPLMSGNYDMVVAPYYSLSGGWGTDNIMISVLDIWPLRSKNRGKARLRSGLLRWSLTHASHIMTISVFSQKEIYAVSKRKADVVLLGTDIPQPADTPFEHRRNQILYVGGYDARKQVGFLIDALMNVQDYLPSDWALALVGNVPQDIQIGLSSFRDHVRYVGNVDDNSLSQLYRESRVFAYPSMYEGFGLPPLEAMAHGTPPVVRDVASLREVVQTAGIVVGENDYEAFGNAMAGLLLDANLWREYHTRCQARANELTWELMHERMNELVYRRSSTYRQH